ncbi:MAG: HAMP domain-containing protein [Leptolyngbya sp. SIO3F4]|nr:HAMP domain-containing protein [Leptolyngbya sp. SIO3F4]
MGLLSLRKFFTSYQNASLPLKISVPFILMFLGFWVLGTASLGYFLANKLEEGKDERAAELVGLVKREINQELSDLQREARLLSTQVTITQGVIDQNGGQLQQAISPLKEIIDSDTISVIGRDKQQLLSVQQQILQGLRLQTQEVDKRLIAGSDVATFVHAEDSNEVVLVGASPVETQQVVIGGVLTGTALNNRLLLQINQLIKEQIAVVSGDTVIASTFPSETDWSRQIESLKNEPSLVINDQRFFTYRIPFEGLDQKKFNLVLLLTHDNLRQAKQTIWFVIFLMATVGAVLTTILGYWIAMRVARPIQDITLIAQQVAGESRFDLRAPANTQDDISILALSLNQLIEWVGQYTYDLEDAAQTLEHRVDERTKELSNALTKLQDTQSQLIQTEKMSSLGQMIAGIAHEINNPIGFIQGNIEPLQEYFQDLLDLINTYQIEYPNPTPAVLRKRQEIDFDFLLKDLTKLLGSMNVGTERVHEIVKSLRNFSRLDEATVKDVNIHDGLDSTLLILNHRIKHNVEVLKDYDDLPLVRCFPAQLNQVFTNIIANALDAMFDADCDRKHLTIVTRVLTRKQVQVIIRDSGPGIPLEVRNKIFDPFFTTKPVGKGTGLGLGICFKIIQQHQGSIDLRSKVGKGTEFIITLPTDVLPAEPAFDKSIFKDSGFSDSGFSDSGFSDSGFNDSGFNDSGFNDSDFNDIIFNEPVFNER